MPLGKNATAGDYVKDFRKSKAPQFKGKSKEKRHKMAIAAYLDKRCLLYTSPSPRDDR